MAGITKAARMISSLIVPERAVVASSTQTFLMGVNPVAAVDVLLTGTWGSTSNLLGPATIASIFSSFRITRKGAAMLEVVGRDALAVGALVSGHTPLWQGGGNPASQRFALGFRLPLSRTPGDPNECLGAVQRGDLQLEYTAGALPGTVSALNISVTQLELPDADPEYFCRTTPLQRTPTAVGDVDIDLPSGGILAGVTLFGTTIPVAAANTKTIQAARLLVNNEEEQIVSSTWEHLTMAAIQKAGDAIMLLDHAHAENSGAAYVQNAQTGTPQTQLSAFANYGLMDLDITRDGMYAVDLTGTQLGQVRITAGDTNPLRVMPHILLRNDSLR